MELKDFIKESLVQINNAIEESNEELKDSTGEVNPKGIEIHGEKSQAYGRKSRQIVNQHSIVHKIDFDVAVYAEYDKSTKVGGKISIASIGLGAGAEENNSNKSESRLKFSIPVIYPEQEKS